MRHSWEKIFDAAAATVNPLNSGKIDIRQVYSLSLVMTSTDGSNAGTVKIQVSDDIAVAGNLPGAFTPTTWVDLPATMFDGSGLVASGAAVTIAVKQINYAWLRLVWTPSAGAGTITATINSQGF